MHRKCCKSAPAPLKKPIRDDDKTGPETNWVSLGKTDIVCVIKNDSPELSFECECDKVNPSECYAGCEFMFVCLPGKKANKICKNDDFYEFYYNLKLHF